MLGAFSTTPSLACVFGGTLGGGADLLSVANVSRPRPRHAARPSSIVRRTSPQIVDTLVLLAETARRDGLLALEARLAASDDPPFLMLGVQMAVDGTRPEIIEDVLRTEMQAVARAARCRQKGCSTSSVSYAPAFGMIGTLLGLVMMLGNMSDPDAIGPGMAVALLTTLYGALLADAVFLPCAEKLQLPQ